MNEFRKFVHDNERWFRGHLSESDTSLDEAEKVLGVRFPEDVRWLLREFGYWHATGISSLDDTVSVTQNARSELQLPTRFIVLYDHQDGGAILLDTIPDTISGDNKVYDCSWYSIPHDIEKDTVFPSYLAYVDGQLEHSREFIAENDIDYDPTKHRAKA